MGVKRILRNVIVGKNHYIDSFTEYNQVMLSGNFALIAMTILLINSTFEDTLGWPLVSYAIAFVLFACSIWFHRIRMHTVANYVLLLTANFFVYLVAASESMGTGAYVFFMVTTIGAFAVFNQANRMQAVFFGLLAFALLCLSSFTDVRILAWREYTPEKEAIIAATNFAMALVAAGLAVSLLIKLNHESARKLSENNKLLIKTNAELDRFVYSTSHDLRAPLTSLMGLINITENVQNIQELKHYINLMRGRVNSLDSFIRDITDYSRNNRREVGSEPINLKELASEVWEDLKFAPEANRIFFDLQIAEGITVISDKNRLKVVLSNLLSNAIRYHDSRKEAQFIRLMYECSPNEFKLTIIDNGQGIATEYHQKIFDMFFRGNESSKGSGLGLYIVKETLDKLSGTISLDSSLGKGAAFTISVPAKCFGV